MKHHGNVTKINGVDLRRKTMANEIRYQCSNCGKAEQTRAMLGIPDGMFYAGYRAHGDVLYCPDCVKTWKERNGAEYDEQYKDPHHLFAMWWNKQVQMQITDKSKIKTYRCNCIGDYLEDYR